MFLNQSHERLGSPARQLQLGRAPVEYRLLTHISMKSKETARRRPTLMMPPAPPCMLKVLTGARGMSQNWLKMPRSSVEHSSCGVQGQPFGALQAGRARSVSTAFDRPQLWPAVASLT